MSELPVRRQAARDPVTDRSGDPKAQLQGLAGLEVGTVGAIPRMVV